MCELCFNIPCLSGCPNEAELPIIETCATCGQPIYHGEEMAFIGDSAYHADCLDSMSTRELLALFDCYTYPAGE